MRKKKPTTEVVSFGEIVVSFGEITVFVKLSVTFSKLYVHIIPTIMIVM